MIIWCVAVESAGTGSSAAAPTVRSASKDPLGYSRVVMAIG